MYSEQFRDTNLWKLALDGQNLPGTGPLAASTFDEHTPDYSPDGKRLAFASTRSGAEEIWISDADGSNPMQVTSMGGPQCANPRWSPDGRTILFNSRREGSADLYLLRPDTGELRRITDDPAEEVEPRWSRDGHTIYFGSNRTGRFEVWKMSASGGTAVRITEQGGLTATESPDGRFLYYAKHEGLPTSIWRVPLGGGEEKLIADGLSLRLELRGRGPRSVFFGRWRCAKQDVDRLLRVRHRKENNAAQPGEAILVGHGLVARSEVAAIFGGRQRGQQPHASGQFSIIAGRFADIQAGLSICYGRFAARLAFLTSVRVIACASQAETMAPRVSISKAKFPDSS